MSLTEQYNSKQNNVDFGSLAKLFSEGQNTRILAAKQQDEINNAKLLSKAIKLNTSKDNNIDLNKALFDYTNAGGNTEQGLKTLLGLHFLNTHEPTMEEKFAQSLALFKAKEELKPENKDLKPKQIEDLMKGLALTGIPEDQQSVLYSALLNAPNDAERDKIAQEAASKLYVPSSKRVGTALGLGLTGALTGGLAGAGSGSFFGPVGAGVGAVVGGLGGAFLPDIVGKHLKD